MSASRTQLEALPFQGSRGRMTSGGVEKLSSYKKKVGFVVYLGCFVVGHSVSPSLLAVVASGFA